MMGYTPPDGQSVVFSPIVLASVPVSVLADVHPLQLGHVPQVRALQLLQPPVVLLVGEVNVPLPLQAVDLQGQRAADAPSASPLLAALRLQILLLWCGMLKA